MPASPYDRSVFLNCPFDAAYAPIRDAVIFAVHDCGFVPRCALEEDDGAQVRIEKIYAIIGSCRLGIHDLSRTELDPVLGLPRFNMPLELGAFLGARRFGSPKQKRKQCLILDRERYRYQAYLSDVAGQDPRAHNGRPADAIQAVRDWLSHSAPDDVMLPGGRKMVERYETFRRDLPALLDAVGIEPDELIYNDYTTLVVAWLKRNPWG